MTIAPLDIHRAIACVTVSISTDRGGADGEILWDGKRVLESLFGRLMHTAVTLAIIPKPDVWNSLLSNGDLIVLDPNTPVLRG